MHRDRRRLPGLFLFSNTRQFCLVFIFLPTIDSRSGHRLEIYHELSGICHRKYRADIFYRSLLWSASRGQQLDSGAADEISIAVRSICSANAGVIILPVTQWAFLHPLF